MATPLSEFLEQAGGKIKLLCVVGPTASGKTDIAVAIAQKYAGEIINADSRQTYKDLEIGTAQPTKEEQSDITHHLFGFLHPEQTCNVAEWRDLARTEIEKITKRGKLPILCGGTGLFVNALTKGFTIPRIAPQTEFREQMEQKTTDELWQMLDKKDPAEAKKLTTKNKRYLIRALEIVEFSGEKKSEAIGTQEGEYDSFFIGLTCERKKLYERINMRIDIMLQRGFIAEVQKLLSQGYTKQTPALQSIGYREALDFLHGERTESEFIEAMKQKSRNYAKRQLTWWRRDPRIHWFDCLSFESINIQDHKF